MSDNDLQNINIANKAIEDAIKNQVKNEIDSNIARYTAFTNIPELLESIKSVQDPVEQAELYKKYLGMLEDHQQVKNEALSKSIENGIEKSKKILVDEIEKSNKVLIDDMENRKEVLKVEMEKDQVRTTMFGDRKFILFLMCFPIIASIVIISITEAFAFASFIIIIWYGMILALYFSQSDALNKLLKNFSLKNS